jgi:hypothetical protein
MVNQLVRTQVALNGVVVWVVVATVERSGRPSGGMPLDYNTSLRPVRPGFNSNTQHLESQNQTSQQTPRSKQLQRSANNCRGQQNPRSKQLQGQQNCFEREH